MSKADGKQQRPFARSAGVRCRGYSQPLQRVIADFGADNAFGRVPEKLKEHYGIAVPFGAVVSITEFHAHAIRDEEVLPRPDVRVRPLTLIAEIDGSMIPVVETGSTAAAVADKRKHRTLSWKEARLSLVRRPDAVEPIFAVTLGDAPMAGAAMKRLALAAGLSGRTRVHGVGDGAPWIAEQMEAQFGARGRYLIDFYHLCDYLAAAAPAGDCEHPDRWLATQKERLKAGELSLVLAALNSIVEAPSVPIDAAPVQQCLRYISNRPGQFNYAAALADNLPIGSGEVESAHRYVIQKRLKLPGAWWRPHNAQAMLNLRSLRANHQWDRYWDSRAAA